MDLLSPLATDEEFFIAAPSASTRSVAFVGDSLARTAAYWRGRIPKRARALVASLAASVLANRNADVWELIERARAAKTNPLDLLAAATYDASAHYRTELLRGVVDQGLSVVGDIGWRSVLPHAKHENAVPYGAALAQIYATTDVSLNATSLQMPTAVNQRVFDVPAAGGFLLTDAQGEVSDLFAPGEEVILYHDAAELGDLCRFYRTHDSARRAIALRAHERVRRQHLYAHRLQVLLELMMARHRTRGSYRLKSSQ